MEIFGALHGHIVILEEGLLISGLQGLPLHLLLFAVIVTVCLQSGNKVLSAFLVGKIKVLFLDNIKPNICMSNAKPPFAR